MDPEEPVALEGEELPAWAGRYLDAAREGGMTLREAVKPLARHLGIPASELYRMAADR
jgi:16S rRNA (cytidine1402-2'-O)-methyltransferase